MESKASFIHIRVTAEFKTRIERAAERLNMPVTSYVSMALSEKLERDGFPAPAAGATSATAAVIKRLSATAMAEVKSGSHSAAPSAHSRPAPRGSGAAGKSARTP